ncbi:hypothetical protein GWR56_13835 [Mucilaginibacter sp. 14171R-50]|uniref:hypothetical protein n=1 Tax=Mucilaginibacter sp. 14171R-50 TaxID=2703789 RepID=UPI00138D72AE|nr:hypothetical protein [Mucilaginibacter sp. 14171R-50]QHS56570.1 hypothetical protein GWR56_13835 [Mucilaginibacter sp. 14171R-50]
MKKKVALLFLVLAALASCQKDRFEEKTSGSHPPPVDLTVAEVKSWWESNANNRADKAMLIDWSGAQSEATDSAAFLSIPVKGQPVFQQIGQGFTKLVFRRNAGGSITANLVEIIPDGLHYQREQKIERSTFTGRIFYYTTDGGFLGGLVFGKGKRIGTIKPRPGDTRNLKTELVQYIEDCQWVDQNYINSSGEVVIYSERICTYTPVDVGPDTPPGVPDSGGGVPGYAGGGGSSAPAPPPMSNLPGEDGDKIDPKAYMDCFGTLPDAGSKMTITVFVQEPAPGLPFNIGPNSVGHTAIGLTKTYKGQTITQVVGFYPDATGKAKAHAPSRILDNSDLKYSISISYNIIASEFNKIVNYISDPPEIYDILTNNCTNFAYNACLAGGIKLPDPTGNMGLGQTGMTPAALGTSLRSLIPDKNVDSNGGLVQPTHGPCK